MEDFLRRSRGVRILGAASLDLAWLAAGRVEGYWEVQLHPWDVAAGVLLVEEAGGRVTDYAGGPLDVLALDGLVASNGRIHTEMVDVLREHGALWRD
jgi:myo-inositol-1(or 4)-monophosphatase